LRLVWAQVRARALVPARVQALAQALVQD